MQPVRIAGVGCCLLDRIYGHIDFRAPSFQKYLSRTPGDGGLEPGKLQFEEEVEHFVGHKFADFQEDLTQGCQPDKENIGGPCIVALINAAQLAYRESRVSFYGCRGDDVVGDRLAVALSRTPVDLAHYRVEPGSETAATTVLSDPVYDEGHGERTFVNTIGASWHYMPADVDDSFYEADICVFGGTAIVPRIHEGLTQMLAKAKDKGCLTVVNTVYDSLNEKKNPGQRWPLGDSDDAYRLIDLLLVDREEALRLSGEETIGGALAFFRAKGAKAVLVTNGARDVCLWADAGRFAPGRACRATAPVVATTLLVVSWPRWRARCMPAALCLTCVKLAAGALCRAVLPVSTMAAPFLRTVRARNWRSWRLFTLPTGVRRAKANKVRKNKTGYNRSGGASIF